MDHLARLGIFVRVVESGSFTAVARERRISQPTASRAVAELEEELGARLLHRTTRRLTPTEAGAAFYRQAARILGELAAAEAEVGARQRGLAGRLRVAAPIAVGVQLVVPAVAELQARHPRLQVELLLADRYTDLVAEGADVAVRVGPQRDSSLTTRPLGRLELALVAAPAYLERAGTPQDPQELRAHQTLGFLRPHALAREEWTLGASRVEVRPRFRSDCVEAVRAAAVAGAGLAVLALALVQTDLDAGRLRRVLRAHSPGTFPVQAVYGARRASPLVAALIEHVGLQLRARGVA